MSTRPVHSVLDVLRARVDPERFDAVVFSLGSVVADLGYGDIRPLVGSVAWIDKLRENGKRTAVAFSGENASAALELAGIADRFDLVESHVRAQGPLEQLLSELGCDADRAIVVDVEPEGIAAGVAAGCHLAIAVARGASTPEQLRRAGADAVVADLQELVSSF